MRRRWLRVSKTALVVSCIALELSWPTATRAEETAPAAPAAGEKTDMVVPQPDGGPRVEVAKLVDNPEDVGEAQDAIAAGDNFQGMSEPPPNATEDAADQGAEPGPIPPPVLPKGVPEGFLPLQLDVKVNGGATGYVLAFYQSPEGKLFTTRGELADIRIVAPGKGAPDEVVPLDGLPTASYAYNETEQSIDIRIGADQRSLQEINARIQKDALEATSDNGVLLNYSVFSALNADYGFKHPSVSGVSAYLESRAFTKWGTLEMSGIIATPDFDVAETTRLNTTVFIEDPKRMLEYQLGDAISGGMNWSRPVRFGGGQVRRNFAMRPDLITMPLPEISGTAGVPSTLDVYIDGVRAYAGELGEGPFVMPNVPVFTDQGTARVVLTDAIGREVEAEGEFFTSPNLLRPGLSDFSAEVGFLREHFGKNSFDYSEYPVAIGSGRYGLTNLLTAEAHAEASQDLQNGGVGALFAVPHFGTFNTAVAASLYDGDIGFLVYGSWEKRWGNILLDVSTRRTIGDYQDLASVNAYELTGKSDSGVPKAVDQISVGYSIPAYETSTGISLVHALTRDNQRDIILAGSISKLFGSISVVGGGFMNFGDDEEYGMSVGFTMPLGATMTASSDASWSKQGYQLGGSISKSHSDRKYSTSWNVDYDKNDQQRVTASGELRTPVGTANGELQAHESGVGGSMGFTGAVVATRDGVLMGRRVGDSFAVVKAGAPGVRVKHENQFVGETGRNGLLLVPNLAPYIRNKFEVDLDSMALTAETPESEKFIVPRSRSGIVVDFNVTGQTQAAIVKIVDSDEKFIPLSTEVLLDGNPEPFVMGYDGEVYLTGLAEKNTMTVKLPAGDCKIEFDYTGDAQNQEFIGPLKCM